MKLPHPNWVANDATAEIEKYTPIQAESSVRCAIMAGASTAGKARPSAIKSLLKNLPVLTFLISNTICQDRFCKSLTT